MCDHLARAPVQECQCIFACVFTNLPVWGTGSAGRRPVVGNSRIDGATVPEIRVAAVTFPEQQTCATTWLAHPCRSASASLPVCLLTCPFGALEVLDGGQLWATAPMSVIEVNMERRRNEGAWGTGVPRENSPTNDIVRHDSHLRKSEGERERERELTGKWWPLATVCRTLQFLVSEDVPAQRRKARYKDKIHYCMPTADRWLAFGLVKICGDLRQLSRGEAPMQLHVYFPHFPPPPSNLSDGFRQLKPQRELNPVPSQPPVAESSYWWPSDPRQPPDPPDFSSSHTSEEKDQRGRGLGNSIHLFHGAAFTCFTGLDYSPSTYRQTGFDSRWGCSRIFTCGNRAGRYRWSVGFLGYLPLPPPLHSDAALYSPLFIRVGSQGLDHLFHQIHVWKLRRLDLQGVETAMDGYVVQIFEIVGPRSVVMYTSHTKQFGAPISCEPFLENNFLFGDAHQVSKLSFRLEWVFPLRNSIHSPNQRVVLDIFGLHASGRVHCRIIIANEFWQYLKPLVATICCEMLTHLVLQNPVAPLDN
ncbi:hypothetical protein PR048_028727 [Dryococelus australis]|uniref:Uncharacterized protein n=1 Tax=Dryococelus australis TaxID=614101 RepID=A0ABQ9GBE2_9NEOP|nr:hypothetical protein PR048_028727 [Dryococelus australis]